MREATASRCGPLVRADGWRGAVLAAFPSAVYVVVADGTLLVVHDADHGCTPTSIQVDRRHLAGIAVGAVAAGRGGRVRVDDLVIDVRQASVWTPPRPLRILDAPVCSPRLAAHDSAAATGLTAVLDAAGTDAVGRALRPIVGRGPGSTPAGDDALVGMLAVLHRATPPSTAAPIVAAVGTALGPLLGRTTTISAHFLRLALDGWFSERLLAVVDDLAITGGVDARHLAALLATGATSGADALAGVVVTAGWLGAHELEEVA